MMRVTFGPPVETQGRTIIYLDWSVVIDLADGLAQTLRNALRDAQASGVVVPFSMAHLVDSGVTNRDSTPEQMAGAAERLAFLSDLTRDHLLFVGEWPSVAQLHRNSPQRMQVGARLLARSFETIRTDVSQYSAPYLQAARRVFDLDPNRLNNMKPPGVVRQLDELLRAAAISLGAPDPEMLTVSYCLDNVRPWGPGGPTPSLSARVATCISSLTFLGYFPDRAGGSRSWSSATDGAHASFASHTTAFVTADKALRLKAMAAYEFLGIGTAVLTPSEAITFARAHSV